MSRAYDIEHEKEKASVRGTRHVHTLRERYLDPDQRSNLSNLTIDQYASSLSNYTVRLACALLEPAA